MLDNGIEGTCFVTQPKRLATSGCGARLQVELDSKFLRDQQDAHLSVDVDAVGILYRGYRSMPKDRADARIIVLTDGLLAQMVSNNRRLPDASVIVIDEVHDFGLNIEYLLAELTLALRERPDLRLVLMSATVNAEEILAHFSAFSPTRIDVEGETKHLEMIYLQPDEVEYSYQFHIYHAVRLFITDPDIESGDCLVFLPGVAEIVQISEGCRKALSQDYPDALAKVEILKLAKDLPLDEQNLVKTDRYVDGRKLRKIIFATNVAETSITLPDIRLVVETGKGKMSQYDPTTLSTDLILVSCSQHQVQQRRGRAGRVSDGVVCHCYTLDEFGRLEKFSPRPLKHADLTPIIPKILNGGSQLRSYPWFTHPEPEFLVAALSRMIDFGLLENGADVTSAKLTALGNVAVQLDLTPELVVLFDYAKPVDGVAPTFAYELLIIISMIASGESIYAKIPEDDGGRMDAIRATYTIPDSDHLSELNLFHAWHHAYVTGRDSNFCSEFGLVKPTLQDVKDRTLELVRKYKSKSQVAPWKYC